MTVYAILTIALIVVLATAATLAIYLGLLNWIGAVHVVRCGRCHHLTVSGSRMPGESCAHCRHPVLLHPIYAAAHPRSANQVRVVGDRLKYRGRLGGCRAPSGARLSESAHPSL
jgi:hypothetical protein